MIILHLTEQEILGDRYRLLERLGQGSFSEVWKARRLQDHHLVALKVPKDQELGEELLRREPDLMQMVAHEHVVQVYGCHNIAGLFVMEMELVEGYTLGDVLDSVSRERPLTFEQMLVWSVQILKGLCHVHGYNIVHGDIKPQNILINPRGVAKLVDFGASRQIEDVFVSTKGQGTWLYMAPEVAFDRKRGLFNDLYSVGVVMYEMVTGTTPYQNPFEMLSGHQLVRPREHNKHTPPELERIILRALEPNLARRYQTCGQILADVEAVLEQIREGMPAERAVGRTMPTRVEFRPDSSSPLYYMEQAKRCMADGDYYAAMDAMEVAVARSDEHPNYLRMLGGLCLQLDYHRRALEVYQKLLATYDRGYPVAPDQIEDVLERLGELFLTTKQYAAAIDVYERLVQHTRRNAYALFKLAVVVGLDGDYRRAIELLEEVRKARPDAVVVYSKLGWAHMAEGNVRQAISFYNQALVLDGADLFSLYELGRYYLIAGDRQRAQEYFARVQRNDKVGAYQEKVDMLTEGG